MANLWYFQHQHSCLYRVPPRFLRTCTLRNHYIGKRKETYYNISKAMTEELKFRIENASELERKVVNLGARFVNEVSSNEIYFNQPPGKVLKIKQSQQGNFLIVLKKRKIPFNISKKRNWKLWKR